MIAEVDENNDGEIDIHEFEKLMKDRILSEMVSADDNIQKYRDMFLEADTDFSGFLSVDELYSVLLK